ncbi:MAG: helix-turn-helix domain-containing protein [Erysipelotrichia bacterium]|nr:helix-turn-helix domain-containing protein [Erysipelotrichia bacterium]
MKNTDFIGTREGAPIAGYHYTYFCKLLRDGVIPAYRVNGRWRISKSELLAFIAKGSNQATASSANLPAKSQVEFIANSQNQ